ncbi:MAG TPA: zinc-ribbon and DUF3426 domain-containing protein [Usitatibacter sp.]
MLVTTCTQCRARFRVTPPQLNAKQGQVRCGRCRSVFNGFEALERFPDDDTGARLLAAREAAERAAGIPPPIEPLPFDELPDIETLEPTDSPPQHDGIGFVEAPAPVASTPPEPSRVVRRAQREEVTLAPPPRTAPPARAWTFGTVLLSVVLAAEIVFAFRDDLAQRYPVLRTYLESVCGTVGCKVAWAHDESLLKLEDSELLEVPGKPSEIALGARIRNLAQVAQAYPHLELTLTDLTGQAAIRRVLRPADYLGRPVGDDDTLAPGAEMRVQLRLETPRIKATGYELLLFYP